MCGLQRKFARNILYKKYTACENRNNVNIKFLEWTLLSSVFVFGRIIRNVYFRNAKIQIPHTNSDRFMHALHIQVHESFFCGWIGDLCVRVRLFFPLFSIQLSKSEFHIEKLPLNWRMKKTTVINRVLLAIFWFR